MRWQGAYFEMANILVENISVPLSGQILDSSFIIAIQFIDLTERCTCFFFILFISSDSESSLLYRQQLLDGGFA